MPPRKRPTNVVRSGNAGNSTKASPLPVAPPPGPNDPPPRPPPLFPLGYKTPIALLTEKCQKMGWEKPVIDSRPNPRSDPTTFTAVVTLKKRTSKNVYDLDSVRLVPLPPIEMPTAQEAKHWGACYALFRFCSHMPLAMVLPPAVRPYWSTLMADKASAPDHRAWEFAPDPFAARKEVEGRQEKRRVVEAQKAEAAASGTSGAGGGPGGGKGKGREGGGAGGWEKAPEVRMATGLREQVEATVRKMMQRFPTAVLQATRESAATHSTLPSGTSTPGLDTAALTSQLTTLGFRPSHIASSLNALNAAHARLHSTGGVGSTNDPLVLSLSTLSPLEAAIEWMLLHLPEDDLPPRYRPSASASEFISSAGSANRNGDNQSTLVRGWVIDRLVKKAGFPRKAVERIVVEGGEERESVAVDLLGRRLCGWEDGQGGWGVEEYGSGWQGTDDDNAERAERREEEVMAIEAVLADRYHPDTATEFSIDIPPTAGKDHVSLRILFDDASPYPSPQHPTHPPSFYITSDTLPAYMRLHLHASLLRQFRDPDRQDLTSVLESGSGGAVLAMVEYLEGILDDVVENPPDVGKVTQFLTPKVEDVVPAAVARIQKSQPKQRRSNQGPRRPPTETEHEAVRASYDAMVNNADYEAMMQVRRKLPAWQERDNINTLLDKSRVLVVVGETGCGKTTQLPQFILDHEIAAGRGASTSIVITQPRRVSALGVAARVAQERMEDIDRDKQPGTVGYAIRGERKSGRDTRLLFCTTGVILRRLGSGGDTDLQGISHIVVDEAHERGVDTDLLICLLRDLLQRNSSIKVILMSATINQQTFINYFGGCPYLEIPGFTHPVKDHYLEDVIPSIGYRPTAPSRGPRQTAEQQQAMRKDYEKLNLDQDSLRALEILSSSDRIAYDLVAAVVQHIVRHADDNKGAVLIFMPGVMEIKQCIDALKSVSLGAVEIMPLHANLSSAEQKRVFLSTTARKIVVSTNVAETSVTIPDVVYVVDSGRVKETQYEAESGMQRLVEAYTSRASGRQRRGRAGRTQPGQCYKLYTRRTEANSMPKFPVPEILRTPLEALFLQVKAMREEEDVKAFLLKAIDPPKMDAIEAAWKTLQDLGAVEGDDYTSKLTALGRHMSMIPVDLRLSKMLVLASIFKCLDPILTVAAILSSKPLFTSPLDKRDEAKKARESFSWARSDLLTDVRAFDACVAMRARGESHGAVRIFCEQNFISPNAFRDIAALRNDFHSALSELGFVGRNAAAVSALSVNSNNDNLVKAIIVGGLYPRIARITMPKAQFEKIHAGSVQKDHEAKEVKMYDQAGRVFIHPSSILFTEAGFKTGFLAYFGKAETSKVFLRDATEVPLYGLLLFGGPLTINHFAGGIMIGDGFIKLRGWTRIGVLVNQLRRLLDAQLTEQIESPSGSGFSAEGGDEVINTMMALLHRDGMTA